MNNNEANVIIDNNSRYIMDLLSKLLTLSGAVEQLCVDRNMDDSVAIRPMEAGSYDTIELREMVTGLGENNTLDVCYLNAICDAIVDSCVDSIKTYSELNPIQSLFSHGVNEMLMFFLIIDENYEREALSFLPELKENIIELFNNAANEITNYLIDNKIVENYSYVEYKQHIAHGLILFCSNKKLKILEER